MKHFILVSVEEPQDPNVSSQQGWLRLLTTVETLELQSKESRKLSRSALLLERESEHGTFARVVSEADSYGLKYEVRYLSSA